MKNLFEDRKNTPIDEKRVAWIENVVSRLSRRSFKTASVMTSPFPISNCVVGEDVKGEVLRYMFCSRGIINKGALVMDRRLKSGAIITVKLANDIGSESKSYVISGKSMVVEPNIEVFSADRLTISIYPNDSEEKINEAWISFIWTPYVSEVTAKQFLIDELEKLDVPEEY